MELCPIALCFERVMGWLVRHPAIRSDVIAELLYDIAVELEPNSYFTINRNAEASMEDIVTALCRATSSHVKALEIVERAAKIVDIRRSRGESIGQRSPRIT